GDEKNVNGEGATARNGEARPRRRRAGLAVPSRSNTYPDQKRRDHNQIAAPAQPDRICGRDVREFANCASPVLENHIRLKDRERWDASLNQKRSRNDRREQNPPRAPISSEKRPTIHHKARARKDEKKHERLACP